MSTSLPGWLAPVVEAASAITVHELTRFMPPEGSDPRRGAVLMVFADREADPTAPDDLAHARVELVALQAAGVIHQHADGDVARVGQAVEPGLVREVAGEVREQSHTAILDLDCSGISIRARVSDGDVPTLAARSEALCAKRPLYPGFRGYARAQTIDPPGEYGVFTLKPGRVPDGEGGLSHRAVNSCIQFVSVLHGRQLLAVEHVKAADGSLHPVQQALVEVDSTNPLIYLAVAVMLLFALSCSIGPFVGQNWVAKRPDRVKDGLRVTYQFCLIWGLVAALPMLAFGSTIASWVDDSPEVIEDENDSEPVT